MLADEEVIAWHRNFRPLKLKRMSWRDHPALAARRNMKPPPVWPLPPLTDIEFRESHPLPISEIQLDDPDNLVGPDEPLQ